MSAPGEGEYDKAIGRERERGGGGGGEREREKAYRQSDKQTERHIISQFKTDCAKVNTF